MLKAPLIGILVLLSSAALSAQKVSWTADADADEVLENGVFRVSFVLRNAEGSRVEYPAFEAFDVLSGPSTEKSISIVNGFRQTFETYSFTLMAKKTGTFEIGPASITVNNRRLATTPFNIKVVEGKPGANVSGTVMPTDDQVFLRAEVDTSMHFPGEQITISYRLYTSVGIRNYRVVREDPYKGFVYRYVKDFDDVAKNRVIDGVQYRVQTLKSVALFPTKSGTYEIEPFIVNVGIGVRDNSRRNFFFSTRSVPKTVRSNRVTLNIAPLSEPAPDGFTGAVGHFAMDAAPEKTNITTDEALVLNVRLASDGDARKWSVPTLEYLNDMFEVYEPNIKEDKSMDERGRIINRNVLQYLMIPRSPGVKTFTVDLPYFNPDSARYLVLKTQPITVQVAKGKGVSGIVSDIGKEEVEAELNDIISLKRPKRAAPVFVFSPLFFILAAIPFAYLFLVWRKKKSEDDYAGLDLAERKRLEAKMAAMAHLESAKDVIEEPGSKYHEALSDALFTYLSGKLSIPHSEISKQHVQDMMSNVGLSQEILDQTMAIIGACEVVLYAGGNSDFNDERNHLYDRTVELILSIDDALKA